MLLLTESGNRFKIASSHRHILTKSCRPRVSGGNKELAAMQALFDLPSKGMFPSARTQEQYIHGLFLLFTEKRGEDTNCLF
jgi:hypothetical protein